MKMGKNAAKTVRATRRLLWKIGDLGSAALPGSLWLNEFVGIERTGSPLPHSIRELLYITIRSGAGGRDFSARVAHVHIYIRIYTYYISGVRERERNRGVRSRPRFRPERDFLGRGRNLYPYECVVYLYLYIESQCSETQQPTSSIYIYIDCTGRESHSPPTRCSLDKSI